MSATPAADGGPGGRPDWLARKYSKAPADPRLAAWADRVIEILAADRTRARAVFAADPDTARRWKNALYDAAYKRWNRSHPDDQISLSANVIDPADGRCKARGAERCTQNGCQPTPGHHGVHAPVHAKTDGRAHQGAKDRESWDYDPLAPRPRRHRPTTAAGPGPGQPFRCSVAVTAGQARPGPGHKARQRPAGAGRHLGPAAPHACLAAAAAAPAGPPPGLPATAGPGSARTRPRRTAAPTAQPDTWRPCACARRGKTRTTGRPGAPRLASPARASGGALEADPPRLSPTGPTG
jgi:hypothetical protein